MQDLLNEDEFIKKRYNPWRSFRIFCLIEVGSFILMVILAAVNRSLFDHAGVGIAILLKPLFMSFIMMFYKKEHILLSDQTILKALFWLYACSALPLLLTIILMGIVTATATSAVLNVFVLTLAYAVLYGFTALIIVAIARDERRLAIKKSKDKYL